MRPFLLEGIFWGSVIHALLRAMGMSRRRPYRVMVRAEPFWWKDVETNRSETGGLFATRVVMAESQIEAEAAAVAFVREAVLRISGNPKETPSFSKSKRGT